MTEKRFIPIFDGTDKRVVGAKDNGKIISFMDMFDLLNDLSEENEQLKQDKTNLHRAMSRDRVRYLNEKEQLKAQLYCDSEEGVCSICKHHYLENQSLYYISKCEKGHEECSTDVLKHCEDFEIKELKE